MSKPIVKIEFTLRSGVTRAIAFDATDEDDLSPMEAAEAFLAKLGTLEWFHVRDGITGHQVFVRANDVSFATTVS